MLRGVRHVTWEGERNGHHRERRWEKEVPREQGTRDNETNRKDGQADLPFRMLLVRLATVTYGLCSQLYEAIVELPMCPVESCLY